MAPDVLILLLLSAHQWCLYMKDINPKKGGGVESAHRNFERSPLGLGQS